MGSSKRVVTEGSDDGYRLPRTGRLVRGAEGVEVQVVSRRDPENALTLILRASGGDWRTFPPLSIDETPLATAVDEAFADVCCAVRADGALYERVLSAHGYKTYSIEEVREQIAAEPPAATPPSAAYNLRIQIVVCGHLGRALDAAGFVAEYAAAFERWDPVIEQVLGELDALRAQTHWSYDAYGLLNAPAIDDPDPLHLVATTLGDQAVKVTIEHASDALLAGFAHGPYNFAGFVTSPLTSAINSALRCRLRLPIEAPAAVYVEALQHAAELFTRVVDVLRLVRSDDIGIVGIEAVAVEPDAPAIRSSYDVAYNARFSGLAPRRSYYHVDSLDPLSLEELDRVRGVLPAYIGGDVSVRGLDVAMRRYRDSRERHRPGDPESLLDLTIALEALVLNDAASGHGELSYRLGIRAARLVGASFDVRSEIFDALRDLYSARSKLAHGATLDEMRQRDVTRVQNALDLGPRVLRHLLLRFLEGDGPSGLEDRDLTEWWRAVELGG